MNFKQFWKDAKSRAKAMSGVEAVKKGFFGGTGIGPALDKLGKAPPDKRVALAKAAVKAIDTYSTALDTKTLDPKQQKNVEALSGPVMKMRKLLKDFGDGKIGWDQLDLAYEDDDDTTEDGGRGMVVSLDSKDKVIHEATHDIATNRKLGSDSSPNSRPGDKDKAYSSVQSDGGLKKADFAKAGSNAPIVLLAHGSTPMFQSSKGNVHAVEFGGKSPQVMIDYIAKTLPKTYSGQIYLDGCFTGSGKGTLVYAEQVYKGLVKKGYLYLQVKGNLGAAATTADGKELVTPADVKRYKIDLAERALKLKPEYDRLNQNWLDKELPFSQAVGKAKSKDDYDKAQEGLKRVRAEREKDKVFAQVEQRYLSLKSMAEEGSKLQIEALTGTWGPEKLPPKG